MNSLDSTTSCRQTTIIHFFRRLTRLPAKGQDNDSNNDDSNQDIVKDLLCIFIRIRREDISQVFRNSNIFDYISYKAIWLWFNMSYVCMVLYDWDIVEGLE